MKRIAVLLLVLALALQPVALISQHRDFYKSGLKAMKAQNWEEMDRLLRLAIAQQSTEQKRGLVRGGYFPHYYLGLARYQLGDCPGALNSWTESESQGVILRRRKEYEELQRLRDDCRKNGAPTLSVRHKKSGREKLRTGQRLVERFADPTARTLQVLERIAPADSDLGQAIRISRVVVEAADVATDLVDEAMAPKEKLESAVNAYFAGNPRQTLAYLEDVDLRDSRARAQVHLFRAAAYYRLHILTDGDADHLASARKSSNLFRQEQWRGDFVTEVFDPRFVRFLQGSG